MFGFRKPTRRDFYQALERAGRAFVATAIAIYPVDSAIGSPIDVDLAKKALFAGTLAAVVLLWRWLLPDFGRSLPPAAAADNPPNVAVAAAEAEGVPAPPVEPGDVAAPEGVPAEDGNG